jgi:hypothetical protein
MEFVARRRKYGHGDGGELSAIRRRNTFALQIFLLQQCLQQTKGAYDGR